MLNLVVPSVLLIAGIGGFLLDDDVIKVATPVGEIVGQVSSVPLNSSFGYRVQKFWGIPYAEPPTGDLRFKRPVRKSNFSGTFDARHQGSACYQLESPLFPSTYHRSEDCLVLNIFAPENTGKNKDQLKSVIVWIHGGGYILGESNGFEGGYLSSIGDVIVVTFNYRLTFYGFLTTGDSAVPGNMGLWDQQLAIQWVHDNIRAFGGNPDAITIAGQSAGSASVVLQAFYPGNKGLFQRAIASSGSMVSPWATIDVNTAIKLSQGFIDSSGCGNGSSAQQITCMKSLPISVLNDTVQSTGGNIAPVVDGEFVMDTPRNIVSGRSSATEALDMFLGVDLMTGITKDDGILYLQQWLFWTNQTDPANFSMPKHIYENISIPYYLNFAFDRNITEGAELLTLHQYTDWTDPDDEHKREKKLTELATDAMVAVSVVQTADIHTNGSRSTFVYEFAVRPPFHQLAVPPSLDGPNTMSYGDDEHFIFGVGLRNVSENVTQANIFETYLTTMTLWSNFAKSGDPNGPTNATYYINTTWPMYSSDKAYLEITTDMEDGSVKHGLRSKAVNLWTNLLPEILNV